MKVVAILLLLVIGALPVRAAADLDPSRGMLLVATDLVRGADFEKSVIVLLHYDSSGAAGLIVNRPTNTHPSKALPELEGIDKYDGGLYYGGPVETQSLRALMRTDDPPEQSTQVVGDVYIVPFEDDLIDRAASDATLRIYVGYAGWAPQQLDSELAQGSWHVVAATEDLVFAPADVQIWRDLIPPPTLRVKVDLK